MTHELEWLRHLGWVASMLLPFFNIPLILRMIKRRSSSDISLLWVLGVYGCLLAMEPSAWISEDTMFKIFATVNVCLFSTVVFCVLYFRWRDLK